MAHLSFMLSELKVVFAVAFTVKRVISWNNFWKHELVDWRIENIPRRRVLEDTRPRATNVLNVLVKVGTIVKIGLEGYVAPLKCHQVLYFVA